MTGCILNADPDWIAAWRELKHLHLEKSATYGVSDDRLANFTRLAALTGEAPERYVALRMAEKLVRALNQIDAGSGEQVAEWGDLSSLALCAEALRRRRLKGAFVCALDMSDYCS